MHSWLHAGDAAVGAKAGGGGKGNGAGAGLTTEEEEDDDMDMDDLFQGCALHTCMS